MNELCKNRVREWGFRLGLRESLNRYECVMCDVTNGKDYGVKRKKHKCHAQLSLSARLGGNEAEVKYSARFLSCLRQSKVC